MSFRELSPWEWETAPVALIGRRKMLLTAADGDRFNSMTVGWGGFGVMWGRPAAFYAIRPNRYSFRLAERARKHRALVAYRF